MVFVNAKIKILSPLMEEIGICRQCFLEISTLGVKVMGLCLEMHLFCGIWFCLRDSQPLPSALVGIMGGGEA